MPPCPPFAAEIMGPLNSRGQVGAFTHAVKNKLVAEDLDSQTQ